jgi:urease accessory protein
MLIEIAKGASLNLQTQSFQRIFQMREGAMQQMEVELEEGASLCYLPHPVVPHEGADFTSINNLFLTERCNLIWGEILTCGRKLNGEIFKFTRLHTRTSIYVDNRLVIKENLLMEPSVVNPAALGQLEGFTHQASLIYLNETADTGKLINSINEWLRQQPGLIFGITMAPRNGVIIRLLGQKAEQLHECLKALAQGLPENGGAEQQNNIEKDKSIRHAK